MKHLPQSNGSLAMAAWRLALSIAGAWWVGSASVVAADAFVAGADFSHLGFFEDRGVVYRDADEAKDGLRILKSHGVNCVRLRLFTSSADQARRDPYNYTNNLDYTLPLAVRAKAAGLRVFLDFHYSDTWADPGKQAKPIAWTNLTFTELEQRIYDYTRNTLEAFRAAGAPPDLVQVGNEITPGLLWTDGRVGGAYDTTQQWLQLGRLLRAAIRGVTDSTAPTTTRPKIVIHLDRGGDWNATMWYFDRLLQQGVEFDIIGESYYPWWHGSLTALRTCLSNAVARYHKPVLIAETAFPWATNGAAIVGITPGVDGQVQFLLELAKILKGLPEQAGVGLCWWGAEYQQVPKVGLAGFDTRSFFDRAGNSLPVVEALGRLADPVALRASFTEAALLLQWPLSGAGMTLTTTSNLSAAGVWWAATNPVQTTGVVFSTTLPLTADHTRFFRLESR
ncbi:MAG TPA: glycosyl hydrolase 53 family protein [Candidatus Saccharimonadales bacterium]|nr:glycosyl hydrolase 53 family protein [Candidatus Saccharimonadales bacterium]